MSKRPARSEQPRTAGRPVKERKPVQNGILTQAELWAKNIRDAREDLFLNQTALAKAIEDWSRPAPGEPPEITCDRSLVSHWEAGDRAPSLRYQEALCAIFGVERRHLFPRIEVLRGVA